MKRVEDIAELQRIAQRMRQSVTKMMQAAGSPAAIEIVAALFFQVMRHDPTRPAWPDRDRLILSKGHGSRALYSAYAEAGYVDLDEVLTPPRLNRRLLPILEASTAPLGNGLSIGLGAALAGRMEKRDYRVYVLLSAEESQERQVWDAARVAAYHQADNLCAIVDDQGQPLAEKWEACGWNTLAVDGRDFAQLLEAFRTARQTKGRPSVVMARTLITPHSSLPS